MEDSMRISMKTSMAALSCGLLLAASPALAQDAATDLTTAQATFVNLDGEEIGTVTLTETEEGVTIAGVLEGVPAGEHGFHVHETGQCDPSDNFKSAGGHFNPGGDQHGFENPEGPHAGDMRNQTADSNNQLTLNVNNDMISLSDGDEGYLLDEDGSALMVHANADDYVTDPSGNSGDRIACAVIEGAGM
jgi:superoxide dismutase, Cu-Zn family